MSQNFAKYTEVSVRAFEFNPKKNEVLDRKKEIIATIDQHYGKSPNSVLFFGFNPMMLILPSKEIYVTAISDEIKKFLNKSQIKYTYIAEQDLIKNTKKFNWVVCVDEYFTFVDSESEQINNLKLVCSLAKDLMITTLRDYKNQDYKEKEFSQPLALRSGDEVKLYLEYHNQSLDDKNSWQTQVWELTESSATIIGPFARRSMFFKQMAKFSIGAGAKNFFIHKNLMYKSLIKKNYEHVISISF